MKLQEKRKWFIKVSVIENIEGILDFIISPTNIHYLFYIKIWEKRKYGLVLIQRMKYDFQITVKLFA